MCDARLGEHWRGRGWKPSRAGEAVGSREAEEGQKRATAVSCVACALLSPQVQAPTQCPVPRAPREATAAPLVRVLHWHVLSSDCSDTLW